MPIICMAPSPTNAMAIRFGKANFAAIAYGSAGHIVARFPEREAIIPLRILISRAYQFAVDPESAERIQSSGSFFDSSKKTLCGLIGLAEFIARASIIFHQLSI